MNLIKSSVNNWIKILSVILALLVFSFGEIALSDISNLFYTQDLDEIMEDLKTDDEKSRIKILDNESEKLYSEINRNEDILSETEEAITDIKETLAQLLESQEISPDSNTEQLKNEYQENFINLQSKREKTRNKLSELNLKYSENSDLTDKYYEDIYSKYEDKASSILEKETKKTEIKILLYQTVFLAVLAVVAVFLYLKLRNTKYAYPVTGYSAAIALMIVQAIYVHSPFKLHYYVFIFIGIAACIALIIWLVKNLSRISKKETLATVKKNLAAKRCPGCSSVISVNNEDISGKGGNRLRSFTIIIILFAALIGNSSAVVIFFDNIDNISVTELFFSLFLLVFPWIVLYTVMTLFTGITGKKVPDPESFNTNNCPVCGLELISVCKKCGSKRHSLLPYCSSCGDNPESAE